MVHPLADVEDLSCVPESSKVWRWTHVRPGCFIGENVVIGQGCFVDTGAVIGDGTRVQNNVSVFTGVIIGERVLVGPNVAFTNDKYPRVREKGEGWEVLETRIGDGVGIGANATIVCGVTIGEGAMIGAGAVVARDVPPGALVKGVRAR